MKKVLPFPKKIMGRELNLNFELGSVFENIIDLLKRMQEDLLSRVIEAVILEVKAKSQPYRLDK